MAHAKVEAKIPETLQLRSLGLSLSGCEQEATNQELEAELRKSHPNCSETFVVCSDTVGSIASVSKSGGVCLISGTGTNAFLKNPDGSVFGCGGWGHILGDEGGAWWISHRAIKAVFDDMDNFQKCPHSIKIVWGLIQEHFSVKNRNDLLPHCYQTFEKSFFAKLCHKLAIAADAGDALSAQVFTDAGQALARAIKALLPNVSAELTSTGQLSIVCVGSVWKSWHLLKQGFVKELNTIPIDYSISMTNLTQTMALGATYLGADAINYDLKRDYGKNCEVFYCYNQREVVKNGNGHSNGDGQ